MTRECSAWCCRYRWTIGYIAVVVTAELLLILLQLLKG